MEKVNRRKFVKFVWFTILVILVTVPISAASAQGIKNPNTIVDVLASGPDTLDPAQCYTVEGEQVIRQIYENLVAWKDESMTEFEPRIAAEVPSKENGLISEDGLTITFPIRNGVHFQNGDLVTPEDVEYSFERNMVVDPSGGPMGLVLYPLLGVHSTRDAAGNIQVTYEQIDKAVEVDGDNVVFHLAYPSPAFLQIISQTWGAILDKKWMIEHGGWPGTRETWKEYNNRPREEMTLFDKAMGAGPYELVNWAKEREIDLKFFDGYYRGPAKIKNVVIKIVPEWSTRYLMLKTGDADIVTVPIQYLDQVKSLPDVQVKEGLDAQEIFAIIFNQHVKSGSHKYIGSGKLDGAGVPPDFFSNLEIRKAFNFAFDFETYIQDVFRGNAVQPVGPLPEGMPYYNPDQEMYHYDPAKAASLFREAYGGQLWNKGFKLLVPYPLDFTECKGMVDILKYDLRQINPKFVIDTVPMTWDEFYGDLSQGIVALTSVIWINDYPDPVNSCDPWLGSSGFYGQHMNLGGVFDGYCQEGATTEDPNVRQEVYYKVQQLAYEEAVAIWGAQPTLWHVCRSWVKGWTRYPPMFAIYANYYYQLWKEAG